MAFSIRKADYFYAVVNDKPDEAYGLLPRLAELGVSLLAFAGVPMGPRRTELSLFPEDRAKLVHAAEQAGLSLDGPHPALLVQGDDELGALANVHARLFQANVDVYASTGISDGRGGFGYVVYVRPEEFERAAAAFDL